MIKKRTSIMGIHNFWAFAVTAFIFIMTPGIDTIFVLNKCIGQGRKAGIYAALGVNTGILVHTIFAALGFSLIIAKSVIAFSILKYAGAAYLLYLGISKMFSKQTITGINATDKKINTSKQNFTSGIVTNVLNPKVALFFLAFFPQFIKPEFINNPVPFIVLGLAYAVMGVIWFLVLTMFASSFSKLFASKPNAGKWLNKISGLVFVLMGCKIALTKR